MSRLLRSKIDGAKHHYENDLFSTELEAAHGCTGLWQPAPSRVSGRWTDASDGSGECSELDRG